MTVVALQDERPVATTESNGGIDAIRDARRLEYDIGTIGSQNLDGFFDVLFVRPDRVIRPESFRDSQAIPFHIDGRNPAASVTARSDHAQSDQSRAVHDDEITHSRIGRVHPVKPDSRHHEQAGRFFVGPFGQDRAGVVAIDLDDCLRAMHA